MIPATSTAPAASPSGLPYQWVAVGQNGNLYTSTSTTASSWTSRTSSFGTTQIYHVATNGVNMYVAVGAAGKLATSPDGITWTQRTSSFGADAINWVAYANGYWVAVGNAGKLATATDPTGTWTQRTSGTANAIYKVVYGGEWVYGAASGVIRSTGTDPTTGWTARTSTLTQGVYQMGYAKTQDIYIAGADTGTTGALASSPDGTTWTARNSADTLQVAYGNAVSKSTVIVLANFDAIQTSTDGITWTSRTEANANSFAVDVDDNGLFAVISANSPNTKIQTSTDGITWTDRGNVGFDPSILPVSICHSSGYPNL